MYNTHGVISVTNSNDSEIRLTLEPWAEEVVLSPGQSVQVAFSGPQGGHMEVDLRPGAVILYGWEGSVFSVKGSER
ncbi:uncharacterized protein SOCEGT47_083310 [Sorangium cellulosum]|uniref:Uncharacterized protein n=2 Tax=Polyangiaceae TaxID=49 RepID=A0A4P2QEW9_SORCE|nr:uncharacterized protein SOCEGT47_083310 [Sorangium cellulosum]